MQQELATLRRNDIAQKDSLPGTEQKDQKYEEGLCQYALASHDKCSTARSCWVNFKANWRHKAERPARLWTQLETLEVHSLSLFDDSVFSQLIVVAYRLNTFTYTMNLEEGHIPFNSQTSKTWAWWNMIGADGCCVTRGSRMWSSFARGFNLLQRRTSRQGLPHVHTEIQKTLTYNLALWFWIFPNSPWHCSGRKSFLFLVLQCFTCSFETILRWMFHES